MSKRSLSQNQNKRNNDISRLVQLNIQQINIHQKDRLQSLLTQQAQYLLNKKEKELLIKKKVKQLQQKYQNQRITKLKKMQDKINKSQHVRDTNIKDFQTKVKRKNQHFQMIAKKNTHNNQQSLQKRFQLRKQFQNNQSSSRQLMESRTSKSKNNTLTDRSSFITKYANHSVDQKIKQIKQKMNRAETNHILNNHYIMQKAKNQANHVQEINKKAHMHKSMIEKDIVNHYLNYATANNQQFVRNKQRTNKRSQDKKKALQEKIKKCHQNLRHIDRQKQQRLDEKLRQKMERKILPKSWRNEKAETFLQKFQQNARKLQQSKLSKGEQILQKHYQLSVKNKTLKQRKDKIYKAIMLS